MVEKRKDGVAALQRCSEKSLGNCIVRFFYIYYKYKEYFWCFYGAFLAATLQRCNAIRWGMVAKMMDNMNN